MKKLTFTTNVNINSEVVFASRQVSPMQNMTFLKQIRGK